MRIGAGKRVGFLALCIFLIDACFANAQTSAESAGVPPQFTLDAEVAAKLRPRLMAASVPAAGSYTSGRIVFEKLVEQILPAGRSKRAWQLRIVENDQFNAYSSPDGVVYVENGLAKLAGQSSGLWAAILSHELAHIVRRDWARRYLYQESIERSGGATLALGDPSLPSSSWIDSEKASSDLGRFSRQLELEADRHGLMLMARAGYHPDFAALLHNLLHAEVDGGDNCTPYSKHPCWEERDRELSRAYTEASIEFDHRWREWYSSPGGNPPVVVFAEEPTLKKTSNKEWEISFHLHCQNLAGAVEVVLRPHSSKRPVVNLDNVARFSQSNGEIRQITGCTSPKTTVTFQLEGMESLPKSELRSTDIYVLDAWGSVLARANFPRLRH